MTVSVRGFKVVAINGGFFVSTLSDSRREAYRSESERDAAWKRAVRDGCTVTIPTDAGETENVNILNPTHRPRFGLTQSEALALRSRLERASVRNSRQRRSQPGARKRR